MATSAPNPPNEFWRAQLRVGRDSPTVVAVTQAATLLEEIALLKSFHYVSPTARMVLDLCEEVARCLQKRARRWHRTAQAGPLQQPGQQQANLNYTRGLTKHIYRLRGWLRFVVSADDATPVADLVAPFESLVSQILPDVKVIIRPRWKYNFSYWDLAYELYKVTRNSLNWNQHKFRRVCHKYGFPARRRQIPHIAVLSYPGIDRRNALALVMLAHEIGHLLDASYSLSSGPKVNEVLNSRIEELKPRLSREILAGEKDETAKEIEGYRHDAEDWISEFVADIIAVRLVGPAYIPALKTFAYALADYRVLPRLHPPLQDRLNWVLAESRLPELNYLDFFATRAESDETAAAMHEYVTTLVAELADGKPPIGTQPGDQDEQARSDLLRQLTKTATERALESLRRLALPVSSCYRLTDEVFTMVGLLRREVPPSQRYVPGLAPKTAAHEGGAEQHFSLASILSAGWIFYLTHVKKGRKRPRVVAGASPIDPEAMELQMVSDLVTLAVKQSSFLEKHAHLKAAHDKS